MKVLIIGGGVSGLVANYVMTRGGLKPTILEPGAPGGEFAAGGLKYIHKTDAVQEMFDYLDIASSVYTVRGGIMLRGSIYLYPEALQEMPRREAERIQSDHFRKTRRTEPTLEYVSTSMNDPAALGPRRALRCDFQEMISELADPSIANIVPAGLAKLDHQRNVAFDSKGGRHFYDIAIMTIPLWIVRATCSFYVPEGSTMRLNVAQVNPRRDRFVGFDYVYTPYTPEDTVHRFSPRGEGYSVEVNGELDNDKLASDLNFIFPDGYMIEGVREGLKGHLLPLPRPVQWPDNVKPIGRFAKWESRATTDVSLQDALNLKASFG